MSAPPRQELRFARERKAGWSRLTELLDRTQKVGLGNLSGPELLELGRLYRRTGADLAYARAHLPDDDLIRRLNGLMVRAHGYVYVSERGGARGLVDFYWREFPELLHRRRGFVLAAVAVSVLGVLLALLRPDLGGSIVPESYSTPHIGSSSAPVAAGFITQNNIRVAFIAFASGVTLGLITLLILFQNGMMLGAAGVLIAHKGQSAAFWPSIAPHGVLELSAIMIAGGAGLLFGWTLLHPGDVPRSKALAAAGADAIRLVAGTLPMFVVAGTLEGFVSFTSLAVALKLTLSALSAVAMGVYFSRKGAGFSPHPRPLSLVGERGD